MHDKIKKLIDQRISNGQRVNIERIAGGYNDSERDTSLISAHVTSQLEHYMKAMYDETDAAEAVTHTRDKVQEYGGLKTQRQFEKHLEQETFVNMGRPFTAFNITVQNGSRVFGPPYDADWSEGNGVGFFSRFDGKVYTIPKANGFSAAGIGFNLTTNESALAAITPQGTYDWNYNAFQDLPFARSNGGLGITIYTNGGAQPTLSRQPVLWSVSGIPAFSGQKGSGRIADAASPAFGFGTVPLAPALLNMVPGSTYLVWVWCWQTSQLQENDAFIAFLSFFMPLVTIDAGPPIVIH